MFKIIVFTHGELAKGLIETSKLIMGEQEKLEGYSVEPGCDMDELKNAVRASILKSKNEGEGVILLTDLLFGTPFNIAVELREECGFKHITGTNLPLLLEILNRRMTDTLETAAKGLTDAGKECIKDCDELIAFPEAM